MWLDMYVHHGRYEKRSDSKCALGMVLPDTGAQLEINTPSITGSSLPHSNCLKVQRLCLNVVVTKRRKKWGLQAYAVSTTNKNEFTLSAFL